MKIIVWNSQDKCVADYHKLIRGCDVLYETVNLHIFTKFICECYVTTFSGYLLRFVWYR